MISKRGKFLIVIYFHKKFLKNVPNVILNQEQLNVYNVMNILLKKNLLFSVINVII